MRLCQSVTISRLARKSSTHLVPKRLWSAVKPPQHHPSKNSLPPYNRHQNSRTMIKTTRMFNEERTSGVRNLGARSSRRHTRGEAIYRSKQISWNQWKCWRMSFSNFGVSAVLVRHFLLVKTQRTRFEQPSSKIC